jgi:CMP-N-acetylneuraminic acid synthetase
MKIIIPARLGSKGLPFKNRQLFSYTANTIPENRKKDTYVTTDDPEIMKLAEAEGFNLIVRPDEFSDDFASTKSVLIHALSQMETEPDEEIIVLYLTYPERSWEDVISAHEFYLKFNSINRANSLLCKKECKTHPYLAMYEDGVLGNQIVPHNLYRRQDYPKCFEICHFVIIFQSDYINNLNNNLYSRDTIFYRIPDVVDVDTKKDLLRFDGN